MPAGLWDQIVSGAVARSSTGAGAGWSRNRRSRKDRKVMSTIFCNLVWPCCRVFSRAWMARRHGVSQRRPCRAAL